jgi:tetratricopeptide (TPR) repeat protein
MRCGTKILLLLFIICCAAFKAQQQKIDSLRRILQRPQTDTNRVNALNSISGRYKNFDPDSAIIFAKEALVLSEKLKFAQGKAHAEGNLGLFLSIQGNHAQSLAHSFLALDLWKKLAPPDGRRNGAFVLSNIATVYTNKGNYSDALKYYFMALKIDEELKNTKDIPTIIGNIGTVYFFLNNYDKTLEMYLEALKLTNPADLKGKAYRFSNLANFYYSQATTAQDANDSAGAVRSFKKAEDYLTRALNIYEKSNSKHDMMAVMNNIGTLYADQGKYETALGYFERAMVLSKEVNSLGDLAISLGNIGSMKMKAGKLAEAARYLNSALEVSGQIGDLEGVKSMNQQLSEIDSIRGNFSTALSHYKQYIAARDSINNEENTRKQTRIEMQFEFDKKNAADSMKVAQEKKIAAAELRAEKNKSYSLYGGLLLVLVFSGFIYNRYRITQKQKKIIEEQKFLMERQKQIVEEKNKDILDSIHYAEKIQRSLLPSEKYFERNIKALRK